MLSVPAALPARTVAHHRNADTTTLSLYSLGTGRPSPSRLQVSDLNFSEALLYQNNLRDFCSFSIAIESGMGYSCDRI